MKKTLIATAIALLCSSGVLGYLAYRAYTKPSFAATDGAGHIFRLTGRAVMERLEEDKEYPGIAELYAVAKGDADRARWSSIAYGVGAFLCAAGGGISLIAARRK